MVQVKVSEGVLQGEEVQNEYGDKFYSFRGIPYAEPPVNKLRFKAPKDKIPWDGVKLAQKRACKSLQSTPNPRSRVVGSEYCLYLNVYTPDLNPTNLLPVMFWIHGGGFRTGSGYKDVYGPEFLVRQGVILVTINYRLGILGFLSLGTADIPGNAGMKDQVAAMRWVQRNIAQFGGDPDNVTIFGQDAGAISVSFHLVSPMTKGLFKRAITQSGTSLCWVSNYTEAFNRARALAKQLGCTSHDDKEIYEFFMDQYSHVFLNKKVSLTYAEETKEDAGFEFGIVEEKIFDGIEAYWTENIYEVLRKRGIHKGVDVINGFTEDEGVFYFANTNFDRILTQANTFAEFFVPRPTVVNVPLTEQLEIGRKLRNYYLGNKDVTKENIEYLVRFFSFSMFIYSAILWQKLCASSGKNKIYSYKFTCKSERNFLTQVYKGTTFIKKQTQAQKLAALHGTYKIYPHRMPRRNIVEKICFSEVYKGVENLLKKQTKETVGHGDDIPYLFPYKSFSTNIEEGSSTFNMVDQFTKLWTNFAKYGDPTPDDSLGVRWTPYTLAEQHYMDIGEELVLGAFPEREDIEYWEGVLREHYPALVL